MSNRYFRFLVICISVLSLMFSFAACGAVDSQSVETAVYHDVEKQQLLTLWKNCLAVYNGAYSQMKWAYDYAQAFSDDNSWESLQKARAACSAAKIYIQTLALPEFTLSQEQCAALMDAGIEVDVVLSEYMSMSLERTYMENTLKSLEAMLLQDVFLKTNVQSIGDWLAVQYGAIGDLSEYYCLTTNYLLMQLDNRQLWDRLLDEYPVVAMGRGEWCDDPDQLMQSTTLVLDRYEERLIKMEEVLGDGEYTLILVQEAIETGNLEYLSKEIHRISGVPAYIPVPAWIPEDVPYYYLISDGETGENRLLQSGEELPEAPASCYISCRDITREQVEAYGEYLKEWDLSPYMNWDEETQTYQVYVIYDQSQMLVQWNEEKTGIYLTDPIACLIPELYLQVMLS